MEKRFHGILVYAQSLPLNKSYCDTKPMFYKSRKITASVYLASIHMIVYCAFHIEKSLDESFKQDS